MKKFFILLLIVGTAALLSAQTTHKKAALKWITGNWHIDAGEMQIYEKWEEGKGDSYIGEGYVIQGKDTLVREIMRIEKIGNFWVFIAQINDGNPVLFTLTATSTATALTFENLEHDNPKRIAYMFINAKEMKARVENEEGGEIKAEEYPYTRL